MIARFWQGSLWFSVLGLLLAEAFSSAFFDGLRVLALGGLGCPYPNS